MFNLEVGLLSVVSCSDVDPSPLGTGWPWSWEHNWGDWGCPGWDQGYNQITTGLIPMMMLLRMKITTSLFGHQDRFNTNLHHFPHKIFKYILLKENLGILILNSFKFVSKGRVSIGWGNGLVLDKPLPQPVLTTSMAANYVTWSQRVNTWIFYIGFSQR